MVRRRPIWFGGGDRLEPRLDAFYGDWPVFPLADVADRDPDGPHVNVAGDRYGRTLPVREG